MNDINKYLDDVLNKFDEYSISDEENKTIKRDLAGFIAQKLFRKKFRKQKIVDSTSFDITNKIKLSIENNNPLHFIILFGGYKHFWNSSSPEVDWAEVFNFKFLYEWISPVITAYEPGVIIEFVSEDWILESMNNYNSSDLDKYSESFVKVIDHFNRSTPSNFNFKYTRLGDIYDKTKMLTAVKSEMSAGYDRWNSLTDDDKQMELKRSLRSVILKDGQGIDRIIESRVMELAYYHVEESPEFSGDCFTNPEHIYISFSYGLSEDNIDHWLTLGSTYASTVDFWIGRGTVEQSDKGFVNRIISKEQHLRLKDGLSKVKILNNDMCLENLNEIEVLDEDSWKSLNLHL